MDELLAPPLYAALNGLEIWSIIGTWFAGISTIIAALVALYIASRSERTKLDCYVGVRVPVGVPDKREFMAVGVTNLRRRTVTVTQIWWSIHRWWHIGPLKKYRLTFTVFLFSPISPSQTPKELKDGDQALFLLDIAGKDGVDFISGIRDTSINNLRVTVVTSTRYSKRVKPEKRLLEKLNELAEKRNQ